MPDYMLKVCFVLDRASDVELKRVFVDFISKYRANFMSYEGTSKSSIYIESERRLFRSDLEKELGDIQLFSFRLHKW